MWSLNECFGMIPPINAADAVKNALGGYSNSASLSLDRPRSFLERTRKISSLCSHHWYGCTVIFGYPNVSFLKLCCSFKCSIKLSLFKIREHSWRLGVRWLVSMIRSVIGHLPEFDCQFYANHEFLRWSPVHPNHSTLWLHGTVWFPVGG